MTEEQLKHELQALEEMCERCRVCGQRLHPDESCNAAATRLGVGVVMDWGKDDVMRAAPLWLLALATRLKEWETEAIGTLLGEVDRVKKRIAIVEAERDAARRAAEDLLHRRTVAVCERNALHEALNVMLKSAAPNGRDHPAMTAAWKNAEAVIDRLSKETT